jgi:hypothetical protein
MFLMRGDQLPSNLKAEVLNAYMYRCTIENNYPKHNPCKARIEPVTDKQWLIDHAFYITNEGGLSRRHKHCEPSYMATTGVWFRGMFYPKTVI